MLELSNLSPAFILTAEFEPLHDKGEAYAERLRQAGISVKATRYPRMIHGFFQMRGVIAQGERAINQAVVYLKNVFANLKREI